MKTTKQTKPRIKLTAEQRAQVRSLVDSGYTRAEAVATVLAGLAVL